MVDVNGARAESNSEEQKDGNKYANLTVSDVYWKAFKEDLTRNTQAFERLTAKLDLDANNALSKDELRLGKFQQKYQGSAEILLGELLLENYDDAAGLALSHRDFLPPAGITSSDILKMHALAKGSVGQFSEELDALSSPKTAEQGALTGGVAGLIGSAAALGAIKYLPAKFKTPLIGGAILCPIIGGAIGAGHTVRLQETSVAGHIQNRLDRAENLLNAGALNGAFNATRDSARHRATAIAELSASHSFVPDVDKDQHIDRKELRLSLMTNTGNKAFNHFLSDNYSDLEFLSRDLKHNHDRGISDVALSVLYNDKDYVETYFRQSENSARLDDNDYSFNGMRTAFLTCAAAGALATVSAKWLPGRFKAAGLISAGVLAAAGFRSSIEDSLAHQQQNAEFIARQRMALERLTNNLMPGKY